MICLPPLREDELLYSACGRMFELIGHQSKKGFCEAIFGPNSIAVIDMPSRLEHLASQLPQGYPADGGWLMRNSTTLPLYLPFLPAERATKCESLALGNGGGALPFLTGYMATRIPKLQGMRLCPECVEKDIESYGEAHWRRTHQIEGTLVCPAHGRVLEETEVERRGRKNRHGFLPVPDRGKWAEGKACDKEQQMAREVHWLLNKNEKRPGLKSLRAAYVDSLEERRFAHRSGRILLRQLVPAFTDHHGPKFLEELGCGIEDVEKNWLADLFRRKAQSPHPIQHILLIDFLGATVEQFFDYAGRERGKAPPPPKPAPRVKTVNSARLEDLWKNPDVSLRALSRELGVDPITAGRKAMKIGLPKTRTWAKSIRHNGKTKN